MTTRANILLVALLASAVALGAGSAAAAPSPLPCDVQTADECQITGLRNLGAGGTFVVNRSLHIMGAPAELRTDPGSSLALEIAGDLVVHSGGKITGHASGAKGRGAAITITVAGRVLLAGDGTGGAEVAADQIAGSCTDGKGGSITLQSAYGGPDDAIAIQAGARISANAGCTAGPITIGAPKGKIAVSGVVESSGNRPGGGAGKAPGGGPIAITAGCDLTVGDTGQVSSRGRDPGADLVRLVGGCKVVISGLVESTGPGHGVPTVTPNQCAGPARPDKPATATACVEVWAGDSLLIDATGAGRGEINADTAQTGGSKIAWIDLLARGSITIKGPGAGPYAAGAAGYAVHANEFVSNSRGGIITVKSQAGAVSLAGLAIQADGGLKTSTGVPAGGGTGGRVTIEAGGAGSGGDVDLATASVRARGATSGQGPAGGVIAVRSWNGKVLGAAPGELNASGGGTPGSVTLLACAGAEYTGAATPAGAVPPGQCGGAPLILAYVSLPTCQCLIAPPCEGPDCGPGPHCEGPQCNPSSFCPLGIVEAVLHPLTGRFPGNLGPDVVVDGSTESIQAAVNTATDENGDGYIIVGVIATSASGTVGQQVLVSAVYAKPFALIGCGVTLVDPLVCDGVAPMRITAAAGSPEHPAGSGVHLYVLGFGARNSQSAPAWLVEGSGRFLEDASASRSLMGFRIVGSGNTVRGGSATENLGTGVAVEGAGNVIDHMDVSGNVGDGIQVTGNDNTVADNLVGGQTTGNHGDGIRVAGLRNTISGNLVYGNHGDGIEVSGGTAGAPNVVAENRVGARYLGNVGNGILVSGAGSGASAPLEIQGNVTQANGLAGIKVTGTGHQLKNNTSGGVNKRNTGCEFEVAPGNINATGNKAGLFAVPGADGSAFPSSCIN